jgi:uncharacterized protein YjbI with pentapeptide repeats
MPLNKEGRMRRDSDDEARNRATPSGRAPFVPLRELLGWRETGAKKRFLEKEARDEASDLIKTTNLDLTQMRAELFFFLAAVLFVAVTTLSITDRDLLFGTHVQLPIFGLSMSFDAFLLGTPLLLLAVHYALLLKCERIREKCRTINEFIQRAREEDSEGAHSLALKTASNFMAQWLITGTANSRLLRHLNFLIYVLSVCLAPVFTLLLLTIRTLPLHRSLLTSEQILTLAIAVGLLALLHGNTAHGKLRAGAMGLVTWTAASLIFCIPDSPFDRIGSSLWPAKVPFASSEANRVAFAPTAFLLENRLDNATGRPILLFSRNLIVTDDRPARTANTGTPKRPAPGLQSSEYPGASFRGRDLRYATLDRSDFRGADFTLADLTGASIEEGDLRGATFGCAAENTEPFTILWNFAFHRDEKGVWVDDAAQCTVTTGLKLNRADLRGSHFVWGQLQKPSLFGVRLDGATLNGVDLSSVDLSLASLYSASLIGADLSGASRIGANLTAANLTGATLRNAELRLAALGFARMDGSDLVGARFVAGDLTSASLIGAEMGEAVFYGARFDKARLWGATPPENDGLAWADLSGATIEKPTQIDLDVIKDSIARLAETERNSDSAQSLRSLIEAEGTSADVAAKNRVWAELVLLLTRRPEDEAFRQGVSAAITENACQDPVFTEALEFWSRLDWDYYTTFTPDRRLLPSPQPDPALNKLTVSKFPVPSRGYFSYYPDTIVPVPPWYDLGPLITRIEHHACPASKNISQYLVAALKVSDQARHAPPPINSPSTSEALK